MGDFNIIIDLDKLQGRKQDIFRIDEILEQAVNDATQDFNNQLIDKLIDNIIKYGLGNSRLSMDMNVEVTDDGVSISMDSEYAMFVEYGTGIVGESNPHPNTSGWIYDINEHGDKGWWYPTVESDPNPYKWRNEFGALYAWTAGMASRPFMYDTWLWGVRSVNNVIDKHIRRALKRLEGDMK